MEFLLGFTGFAAIMVGIIAALILISSCIGDVGTFLLIVAILFVIDVVRN